MRRPRSSPLNTRGPLWSPSTSRGDSDLVTDGPDVKWEWSAEPTELTVKPDALPLPSYSLQSYAKAGLAPDQIAAWARLALAGQVSIGVQKGPRQAPENLEGLPKTSIAKGFRPLLQQPVIDRAVEVVGDLTVAPRKINLNGAEEP